MIPIASILAAINPALSLVKEHWKTLLIVSGIIWIIICTLTHCNPQPTCPQLTVIETTDTIQLNPDTTKWTRITDSKPPVPTKNEPIPKKPTPEPTSTDKDSIIAFYKTVNQELLDEIEELSSIRTYSEQLETDSFRLRYSIQTKGLLNSAPIFEIQHTFPTLEVVKKRIESYPIPTYYRSIDVGLAVGPDFTLANSPQVRSAMVSLYLGYSDLRRNSFGIVANMTHLNWSIQISYKKRLRIGK